MKDSSIAVSDLSLNTNNVRLPTDMNLRENILPLFYEENLPRLTEGLRAKPIELDPSLTSADFKTKELAELKEIKNISFSTLERIAKDSQNKNATAALMILIDIVPTEGTSAMKQALAMILAKKLEHAPTLMELMADPYHRSVRNLAGNILKNQITRNPLLADELLDRVEGKTEIQNKQGAFTDESVCLALAGAPNNRAIEFMRAVLNGPHSDPAAKMIAKIGLSRLQQ